KRRARSSPQWSGSNPGGENGCNRWQYHPLFGGFNSQFSWIRDLSEGPWYSVQIAPGIHHTMGGIVINTKGEVISTQGSPIPGLYACGEVTGGVHGGNRVGGNAILDCLVFGTTAGKQAATHVK
ncbi:MAG TPA: FAD-binding protein, partial [Firmicutes bacterium]|nr:FAD-binding protein [Bacillota bacterium]